MSKRISDLIVCMDVCSPSTRTRVSNFLEWKATVMKLVSEQGPQPPLTATATSVSTVLLAPRPSSQPHRPDPHMGHRLLSPVLGALVLL